MTKKKFYALWVVFLLYAFPENALAMHIMEGFLPVKWAAFWTLLSLPVIVYGIFSIRNKLQKNPELKMLLGVAGAFAFVMSALKIPSVTGSSSHPTGTGLGAILFGPAAMSVLGLVVLLFQAILLAHGGLTTLGANVFSMAIVGTFVAYGIFKGSKKLGLSDSIAVFAAASLGNLMTYVTTSFQLALAFPAEIGGVMASASKFLTIFAVTQIPLAISEGLLTVVIFNFLRKYSAEELKLLNIFKKGAVAKQ